MNDAEFNEHLVELENGPYPGIRFLAKRAFLDRRWRNCNQITWVRKLRDEWWRLKGYNDDLKLAAGKPL